MQVCSDGKEDAVEEAKRKVEEAGVTHNRGQNRRSARVGATLVVPPLAAVAANVKLQILAAGGGRWNFAWRSLPN